MIIRFLLAFAVTLHRIATKLRIAAIEAETSSAFAGACAAQHRRYQAQDALREASRAIEELRLQADTTEYASNRLGKSNERTIAALKYAAL